MGSTLSMVDLLCIPLNHVEVCVAVYVNYLSALEIYATP